MIHDRINDKSKAIDPMKHGSESTVMSIATFGIKQAEHDERDRYVSQRDLIAARIGPLPGPRIWTPEHLADFFGFTVDWVYNQTRKCRTNSPPRVHGIREIR